MSAPQSAAMGIAAFFITVSAISNAAVIVTSKVKLQVLFENLGASNTRNKAGSANGMTLSRTGHFCANESPAIPPNAVPAIQLTHATRETLFRRQPFAAVVYEQ